MYVLALGVSGLAVLGTVFLPTAERGFLVATTASATIGVAIGGFSIETFFLAQGRRWLDATAGARSFLIYLATIPLSALLGWLFAAYSAEASPGLSAAAAAVITAGNIPGAAGLSADRFVGVYRFRAASATGILVCYGVLAIAGVREGMLWLLAWFGCQLLLSVALWVRHAGLLKPSGGTDTFTMKSFTRMGVTHVGVVAQVFTYRFDQLALSRYQGSEVLAVYSLAIAAVEFAQAGAVVSAQRVLGDHDNRSQLRRALNKAVAFAVGTGLLTLVGLAAIGWVISGYEGALLIGAILLPRTIFVVVGKILGARLVNRKGERITAAIALATSASAIVAYSLVVPVYGAIGAAIASAALFGMHALATAVALRIYTRRHRGADATPAVQREGIGELV